MCATRTENENKKNNNVYNNNNNNKRKIIIIPSIGRVNLIAAFFYRFWEIRESLNAFLLELLQWANTSGSYYYEIVFGT